MPVIVTDAIKSATFVATYKLFDICSEIRSD